MNKAFVLVLLLGLFAAASPIKAQEQTSKLEAYGGYYYVHFNVNANVPGIAPSATYNGNGGGGQLEYNANRWLGVGGGSGRLWGDQHRKRCISRRSFYLSFWAQSELQARQSYAVRSDALRRHSHNRRDWPVLARK